MSISASNCTLLERILRCKALHLGEDMDPYDCYNFWDAEDVLQWFSAKNYTLYRRERHKQFTSPALPFEASGEADYPHAYHNACPVDKTGQHVLTAKNYTGRIAYAQDAQGRHVVIKATHTATDEYRILRFLRDQTIEMLREHCLLPILDLLHYDDEACFVVMPRWGSNVQEPCELQTLEDVLRITRSVLKSLQFLHSRYIVHRDLSFANILVNHFGGERMVHSLSPSAYWKTRAPQLLEGKLEYALIDFDLAKMLPANAPIEIYSLPAKESYVGTHCPGDTSLGEFEYNPFAYDVGTLGLLLRDEYKHHTKDIPLLAPLLDRLTTTDTRKRFTATDALRFVEQIIADSTEAQLSTPVRQPSAADATDIWEGLPPDFQKEWAVYREPTAPPLTTRFLRALVQIEWLPIFDIVRNIRWFSWKLTSPPRHAWGRLTVFVGLSAHR